MHKRRHTLTTIHNEPSRVKEDADTGVATMHLYVKPAIHYPNTCFERCNEWMCILAIIEHRSADNEDKEKYAERFNGNLLRTKN